MTNSEKNHQQWLAAAEAIIFPDKILINGSLSNNTQESFAVISPIDGVELCQLPRCQKSHAEQAIAAAKNAFQQGDWSRAAPAVRKKTLLKFAALIDQHRDELALLESLDMGKPITYALADITNSAECIRWYAEAIDKIYGEIANTPENTLGLITREAIGVVVGIVPWNFPLAMAVRKIAPALVTGNSVILKPSEKSSLTALRLAELSLQIDFPPGVFNVITGFGHEVGEVLALSNDVDAIAFTGSTLVGKKLLAYSAQSNMKRVFMECGGKSPNIVFADCEDMDAAARAAATAIFYNQGEVCVAGSRLLVENSIKDVFIERVMAYGERMQPGHPLNPDAVMGAIVDEVQLQKILSYIDIGVKEGAQLKQGGQQLRAESGGFYVAPTVFDGVDNTMQIAKDEIFGPVLSVIGFDTEEQAVAIANDTDYGLAAGLWTGQLKRAHRVSRALRAGTVWVNNYFGGDMTMPFGGYKQSGNARDKSLHALEHYTEIKATWINL